MEEDNLIKLSTEQQAVIDWFKENDKGNLAVLSMAGSGKSFLLHQIIKEAFRKHRGFDHFSRNLITCISFNRSLANQMRQEVSERVWVNTAHSILGNILHKYVKANFDIKYKHRKDSKGEWTVVRVDDDKIKYIVVKQIAKEYGVELTKEGFSSPLPSEAFGSVRTIVDVIRMTHLNGINHTDLDAIKEGCKQFGIVCSLSDIQTASWSITKGIQVLEAHGIYSNDEVLYLLSSYYPFEELKKFAIATRILLLDEVQDMSDAMHTALRLIMTDDTQVIMVGDSNQSIYHFAYVSPSAIHRAVDYLQAETLGLSISFRCPNSHIDLVNQLGINSEIQSAPLAEDGTTNSTDYISFLKNVEPGSLVISRNLVGKELKHKGVNIAVDLLDMGKPVNLSRWNLDTLVIPVVSKLIGKVLPNDEFIVKYADKWLQKEINKLYEKPNFSKRKEDLLKEQAYVTIKMFKCFARNEKSLSIRLFLQWMDTLVTDQESGITLGSFHSCKGRTHRDVFIFNWDEIVPFGSLTKISTEDEIISERNLIYVALTRGTDTLTFVDNPIPSWYPTLQEMKNELWDEEIAE